MARNLHFPASVTSIASPFTAPATAGAYVERAAGARWSIRPAKALSVLLFAYLSVGPISALSAFSRAFLIGSGTPFVAATYALAISSLAHVGLLAVAIWLLSSVEGPVRTPAQTAGAVLARALGAVAVIAAAIRLVARMVVLPGDMYAWMGPVQMTVGPALVVAMLIWVGPTRARVAARARVPGVRWPLVLFVLGALAGAAASSMVGLGAPAHDRRLVTIVVWSSVGFAAAAWAAQVHLFWRLRRALQNR